MLARRAFMHKRDRAGALAPIDFELPESHEVFMGGGLFASALDDAQWGSARLRRLVHSWFGGQPPPTLLTAIKFARGPNRREHQMAARQWRWVRVRALEPKEKADFAAGCNRLIADVLKPRYLPEIRPTELNYPVDLHGKWRGSKFSFLTRYRSGFPDNAGEEFDSPFARLDHVEECVDEIRFDVMWRRHTGQYWPLHRAVPLAEALRLIETEPHLRPFF